MKEEMNRGDWKEGKGWVGQNVAPARFGIQLYDLRQVRRDCGGGEALFELFYTNCNLYDTPKL